MQLSITTRHGHLSESTQAKLRTKAEKLHRIFDRLSAIELIVDLGDDQETRVDIKVSAEHKHDFVAHGTADNLLGAVDQAVHKTEQQLRKYKERVQERHRSQRQKHDGTVAAEEAAAENQPSGSATGLSAGMDAEESDFGSYGDEKA